MLQDSLDVPRRLCSTSPLRPSEFCCALGHRAAHLTAIPLQMANPLKSCAPHAESPRCAAPCLSGETLARAIML